MLLTQSNLEAVASLQRVARAEEFHRLEARACIHGKAGQTL